MDFFLQVVGFITGLILIMFLFIYLVEVAIYNPIVQTSIPDKLIEEQKTFKFKNKIYKISIDTLQTDSLNKWKTEK